MLCPHTSGARCRILQCAKLCDVGFKLGRQATMRKSEAAVSALCDSVFRARLGGQLYFGAFRSEVRKMGPKTEVWFARNLAEIGLRDLGFGRKLAQPAPFDAVEPNLG